MGLKSLLCVVALGVMSASCVTLDGQLDVKQTMIAKKRGGFLNLKLKDVEIRPELFQASLKINSDKSFTLKLKGEEEILLPIKSENSLKVPSNGHVKISHAEIAQPFDIEGEIRTDINDSNIMSSIEDCSWTVTENHCQKVCDAERKNCNVVCKEEQVTIHGRHEVDYHFRTTHRDLAMELLKQDSSEVLASFHGSDVETDRIIDHEGLCR